MRSRWIAPLLVVVLVGACAPASPTPSPATSTDQVGSASATPTEPTASASATPSSRPAFDASGRPLVWFAPLGPRADHHGYGGAVDFYDLFEPGASWSTAVADVDVFQVYGTWVTHYSTDDELTRVIDGVAERGLGLGLEVGPLKGTNECEQGEGWAAAESLDVVRRIQAHGGRVDVVALDEPYAFGHVATSGRSCLYPVDRVAREVAEFVADLRVLEPDVIVGDVEPMWSDITPGDMAVWIDAYAAAAGEPFAFLHLDADWNRADWAEALLATERASRDRGVPFGIIYNGGDAASDEEWTRLAMDRAVRYEEETGGRPDHIVFQSWFDHPDRVLPDTDVTTFTGLIAQYSGARTEIAVDQLGSARPGVIEVGGAVTAAGMAVGGASLTLSATPLDGARQELTLGGEVPAGASRAVVGIRANTEDAGPGPIDIVLYRLSYREAGDGANLVPNPRFAAGLDQWGISGSGSARLVASDSGPGRALRLSGSATRWLSIDTGGFAVTPGARFELNALVSVPVSSAASAYAAVIFLGPTELARERLPIEPQAIALGTVASDAEGRFQGIGEDLPAGRYRVRIDDRGSAQRWPAHRSQEVLVP